MMKWKAAGDDAFCIHNSHFKISFLWISVRQDENEPGHSL